jgi:phage portal protein BeeE
VELVNAELASVDDGYIQQRIENRHEIYNAFGVPMSMADIKASYSIGSASDMFQCALAGSRQPSSIARW